MDLSPILARLRGQLTGLAVIGGAVDLSAVEDDYVATPACYLVAMSESAEDILLPGSLQQMTVDFSVFVAVSGLGDVAGEAAMAELEPVRAQVRAAILGWTPVAATGFQIRFVGGRLIKLDNGLLWWADEYRFNTLLQHF